MALLGASGIVLALLMVLSFARMDLGLVLEGSLTHDRRGWTISVQVPAERLPQLGACSYVRIRSRGRDVWRGPVSKMSARWDRSRRGLVAKIEIEVDAEAAWPALTDTSVLEVQATLIERRNVSLLRVLLESVSKESRARSS